MSDKPIRQGEQLQTEKQRRRRERASAMQRWEEATCIPHTTRDNSRDNNNNNMYDGDNSEMTNCPTTLLEKEEKMVVSSLSTQSNTVTLSSSAQSFLFGEQKEQQQHRERLELVREDFRAESTSERSKRRNVESQKSKRRRGTNLRMYLSNNSVSNNKKGFRWNAIHANDGNDGNSNYNVANSSSIETDHKLDCNNTDLYDEELENMQVMNSLNVSTFSDGTEVNDDISSNNEESLNDHSTVVLDQRGNLVHYSSCNVNENNDSPFSPLSYKVRNRYCRKMLLAKRRCSNAIICGFCAALIMIMMMAIVVNYGVQKQGKDTYYIRNFLSDKNGTQKVTLSSESQRRFEEMRSKILERNASSSRISVAITHPSAFEDVHSAQYTALKWLAEEDPRQMDPSDDYLVQRYGLVVLWFSTTETEYEWHIPEEYAHKKEENDAGRALGDDFDNSHNGDHNHRSIVHRELESDEGNSESRWTRHEHWLSDVSVCRWEGITCHSKTDDGSSDYDGNLDGDVSRIEMNGNNINGLIPRELFTTMPHLTKLDMSDNGLSGTLSTEIVMLEELNILNFTSNKIGGSIPDGIGELSNMKILHLSNNLFEGSIPESIGDLSELRGLDLSRNDFQGTLPHGIGRMTGLTSLNISSNFLMGQMTMIFSELSNLVVLDVSNNYFGGPVGARIGKMSYLEKLLLNNNHFSGIVPTEIGRLIRLDELLLSNNDFIGTLPREFANIIGLDTLSLSSNHLQGTLPLEWTTMTTLHMLDISKNKIDGTIPTSIQEMKNLRKLNLGRNDLTGQIPLGLGSLLKLELINLENNKLRGTVPEQLGELTKLEQLILHNNNLTGVVPEHVCKLTYERSLVLISVDCAGVTAPVVCDCCSCHERENFVSLGG